MQENCNQLQHSRCISVRATGSLCCCVCLSESAYVALDMRRSTTLDLLYIYLFCAQDVLCCCCCCCWANALESTPLNETHCHANTHSSPLCKPQHRRRQKASQLVRGECDVVISPANFEAPKYFNIYSGLFISYVWPLKFARQPQIESG